MDEWRKIELVGYTGAILFISTFISVIFRNIYIFIILSIMSIICMYYHETLQWNYGRK